MVRRSKMTPCLYNTLLFVQISDAGGGSAPPAATAAVDMTPGCTSLTPSANASTTLPDAVDMFFAGCTGRRR